MTKRAAVFISLCVTWWAVAAMAQATDYIITEIPVGAKAATDSLYVKWTGGLRNPPDPGILSAPDYGYIYFDKYPGGYDLKNYRYQVKFPQDTIIKPSLIHQGKNNIYFPATGVNPPMRGTRFRPIDQVDSLGHALMGPGVYYCVIALPLENDTLFSNEFQIIVETSHSTTPTSPTGTIGDLTPTFTWQVNPGVPYYHVILSDEEIAVDSTTDTLKIGGLSVIWQAITANTQIVYGAPDPSGTITASPPPLSPGQKFTWVVLNNYGNHPAYTSTKFGLPSAFTITGTPLRKPVNVAPLNESLRSVSSPKIVFKWTNLDPLANTYKVYIYTASQMQGIDARLVVWENEVTAGNFAGSDGILGPADTGTAMVDARAILTTNHYVWKVIAVDGRGAGSAGDTGSFDYISPTGTLQLFTAEKITSNNITSNVPIGLVEIRTRVLEGSMEAPLLFYSDPNGWLDRPRPVGTYEVTAVKNGYSPLTATVSVDSGRTTIDTLFLQRPEATVFGKVVGLDNIGVNLAKVMAISDLGDTARAEANPYGNFLINCSAADWRIWAEKEGYAAPQPVQITVAAGESYDFGNLVLARNQLTISGLVTNDSGEALLGARVRLLREGVQIDALPATAENGVFSFAVASGSYQIEVTKTGFVTFTRNYEIANSRQITAVLTPGAALVRGYVIGRSWIGSTLNIAPVTGANLRFVSSAGDTFSCVSGTTYGDFRISLTGGASYTMLSSADGFMNNLRGRTISLSPGQTIDKNDTLTAFGAVFGNVWRSDVSRNEAGVLVSLIDTVTGTTARSILSAVSGEFEIRNVEDGVYRVLAGKDSLIQDRVQPADIITVDSGRVDLGHLTVSMIMGSKKIAFSINRGKDTTSTIKVRSPLQKTIGARDTLFNMGRGDYSIVVASQNPAILDLSHHTFHADSSGAVHLESVSLPVRHTVSSSLSLRDLRITLILTSDSLLDSARLYYRDINSPSFLSAGVDSVDDERYFFAVEPPRNGSDLVYYFKAYRNNDSYGYDQETYVSYVLPDTTRLTRFEIIPGGEDTLTFPAHDNINLMIGGYVGAAYAPKQNLDGDGITWSLVNQQGCELSGSSGVGITMTTGGSSTGLVRLAVKIDTTIIKLARNVARFDTMYCTISEAAIESIFVFRIDNENPNPITTSLESFALFQSRGVDRNGNSVSITPEWRIDPPSAGAISAIGEFRPAPNFAGYVRVFAKSTDGKKSGEYVYGKADSNNKPWLKVHHVITRSALYDTATNGQGCSVIFPPECIGATDQGLLEIGLPAMDNAVSRGISAIHVVGQAYEIDETKNITLEFAGASDSIRVIVDVPSDLVEAVKKSRKNYKIGLWNSDSLYWDTLANSVVADDGSWVSAAVPHFSRYAMVSTGGELGATLTIKPNPFSPYITPRADFEDRPDAVVQKGTCISFTLDSDRPNLENAQIRIYNITGELAYSVILRSPEKSRPYYLWWDGKTTETQKTWTGEESYVIPTSKMCRNGRYFLVLSIKDLKGKEKHFMKPLVLLK